MNNETLKKLELGYGGYRYFSADMHPELSGLGQKVFARPTAYENHEELEFIFVRSGEGRLMVNNRVFSLAQGVSGMFMSFDMHRFLPAAGNTLVIDYFRISYGTYLYIMACPYSEPLRTYTPDYAFHTARLSGEPLAQAEALFDRLHTAAGKQDAGQLSVFLLIELLGVFRRGEENEKKVLGDRR